ncbi:DUF2878 domain-containing protein [Halomonas vilamensis]|uniref:DUF2878 domain-containing protein n=1 Tax=Vreelandella vilamensis TaxID=531309 RepID=A0ABU1H410_9GAMM|nr:DUF2878 domain-containing protein [Halomonas vilamensis]MDR5899036.1 DUF2878 domain-containing protein [Halomonas vilamensis]
MATAPPSWRALLANVLRFEAGWLLCVLGGSWVALLAGSALIAWHLRVMAAPGEWRLLLGFALLGLALDGGLALLGGFDFSGHTRLFGLMPLWLWMLWPLFATLILHSLRWLWRYPLLAFLGGAVSGPLSYYGGAMLADVAITPWLLPTQAVIWGTLCVMLARYFPRFSPRYDLSP